MAFTRLFKQTQSFLSQYTHLWNRWIILYIYSPCLWELLSFYPFFFYASERSVSCNFPTNNWWLIQIFPVRTARVLHLHLITQKILGGILITKLFIVSFSSFLSYFGSLRFKYSLGTLLSNVPATSLCFQDVRLGTMSSSADVERDDVHFDEPWGKQLHADVQQNSTLDVCCAPAWHATFASTGGFCNLVLNSFGFPSFWQLVLILRFLYHELQLIFRYRASSI